MTEREFETLLATYLDGHLRDEELIELEKAVREHPKFRMRFQAELRLHTLLRERARSRLELTKLSIRRVLPPRLAQTLRPRLPLIAAACLLLGVLIPLWRSRSVSSTGPAVGVCLWVTGDVVLERGQAHITVTPDTPILPGDRIISGLHADSLIRLADHTVFSITGGSAVRIDRIASRDIEVVLERGEAMFEAKRRRLDGRLLVRTPHGMGTVLGTTFIMEAQPSTTRLKVYKGVVEFRQTKMRDAITVEKGQYARTGPGPLLVRWIAAPAQPPTNAQLVLSPTDDVHIQDGVVVNTDHLYIEGKRRISYMRFDIPDIGIIHGATLQLTQLHDSGRGTISFYRGSHADWTEMDLAADRAPQPGREIAQYSGFVGPAQVVKVDVSDLIEGPGACTIIMTLDRVGDDDIAFGSRESPAGPKLIIHWAKGNL